MIVLLHMGIVAWVKQAANDKRGHSHPSCEFYLSYASKRERPAKFDFQFDVGIGQRKVLATLRIAGAWNLLT